MKEIIIKDFNFMKTLTEEQIEDYLYETTQSLSKNEAENLINIYLDIANKRGHSYEAPIFKELLKFSNKLKKEGE